MSSAPVDHPTAVRATPPDLLIHASAHGGRVLVTIRGDLDLSAEREVQTALRHALGQSTRGVDLDLSGIAFCDCSGLNCFLTARRHALKAGKTLTIRAASAPMQRLLSASGTWPLFTLQRCSPRPSAGTPETTAACREDALDHEDLRTEVVQLRRAMQTRPLIDQATGVLMATFSLTAQDAFSVLVAVSQNTNTKLVHIAENLVTTVQGQPLPDAVQQQVAAAVTALRAGATPSDSPQREQPVHEDGDGDRTVHLAGWSPGLAQAVTERPVHCDHADRHGRSQPTARHQSEGRAAPGS
ncbi:ANTAR domain-containing protein [Streptomyces sp. NPDC054833]